MHLSTNLLENMGIAAAVISIYAITITLLRRQALRAQRIIHRQQYDRMYLDVMFARTNEDLCELCLEIDRFFERFYEEDPETITRYIRLLKKFIGKKLLTIEEDQDQTVS